MANTQRSSKINDLNSQQHVIDPSPIPLMSIIIPSVECSRTLSSSSRTSISEPTYVTPTPPISIIDDNSSSTSTSTLIDRIDISKFHFAHVIKVSHGTNLLASDNQSTTVCINSIGNIIHLITPTGYHIRSSRWPETEKKIKDLFWCETLQVYLAVTSTSVYTLKYDSNQSFILKKSLDFPLYYSSSKIFIACNSYRLYIHGHPAPSIDIYTLQFAHLHTKQLPDCIVNNQIEAFACSDSFLIFNYKTNTNKLIILDPTTMIIEYEFDLSYQHISSIRFFDDENTLVFIGVKQDGEYRLVFFTYGNENEANEMQQTVVEKAIERGQQFICLLPNCRDLMILNVNTARVQYLKYRS